MGFSLGGSTAFSQHHLLQYGHRGSSSHSCPALFLSHKKVAGKEEKVEEDSKTIVMARPEARSQKEESRLHRRAVLLVGLSAFPLLQKFGAVAGEAAARGETEMHTAIEAPQIEDGSPQVVDNGPQVADSRPQISDAMALSFLNQNQSEEPALLEEEPKNQLFSLLNVVGVFVSGVLGALSAISHQDRAAVETKLQSMKSTLEDKEASIMLLEKNFEERMSNEQGEHRKQIKKLKEEEYSLLKQLASASATISSLGQALRSEKWLVEDLKVQLDQVQNCLLQANEQKNSLEQKIKDEKDNIVFLQDRVTLLGFEIKDKEEHIEELNTSIRGKESEYKNLNSSLDQIKNDHKNATSSVKQLTAEILQIKQELDAKNHLVNDLIEKLKSLTAEKDDVNKRFCTLQNAYDKLKLTSAKQADSDLELLSKKSDEIRWLEQQLGDALDEIKKNHASISNLNKEKNSVKVMLEEEMNAITDLQNELYNTKKILEDSKLEVSNLSNQLGESERKFELLEVEYSGMQEDFSEKEKSLITSLDEVKSAKVLLSDELGSVTNILDETQQELSTSSAELKTAIEAQEGLQKELLEVHQKAEAASHDLKEERQMVAALRKELDASGEEIVRESGARKTLEGDITEAKRSLAGLEDRIVSLSKELESANSRAAGLKEEKELAYKSLMEQKDIAKEAQENIEDAQNLIVRLGAERESLQNRAEKLEGELVMAKGEILRLRHKSGLSEKTMNKNDKNTNRVETTTSVIARKSDGRKKRGGNAKKSSQQ